MPGPQQYFNSMAAPLHHMARSFGVPLSRQSMQPFMDMAKDQHRMQNARLFAGPLGMAATHMAPIVPESMHGVAGAGNLALSTAVPQMLGMANPAMDAGAGLASGLGSTVMGHLAPVLAMGALGAGGAVLGTYGISKMLGALAKRRARKRMQQQPMGLGLPKFSSILEPDQGSLEEQGAAMFRDIRFVKHAAAGALGYEAPANFKEAIRKVAFTAGLLSTTMSNHAVNGDEAKVITDLVAATKMAKDLTRSLRNRLRVKTASASYDYSLEAIARECYSGQHKKTAAAANAAKGIGAHIFDNHNKAAAALEVLGVDEVTLRSLTGGKQTSGYTAGVLGLIAA